MRLEELKQTLADASQVFVLTDENVAMYWLPELEHWLECEQAVEIIVKAGERNKTLDTARQVWETLLKHGADRHAVLVNLGGGMICDLGGFVASCYQRGIRFVNVPTTLLAMVDAAIGGKTGVDLEGCKNQIGTFAEPIEVMISPVYLSTLPERDLYSGLAEMVKYGFIEDEDMLQVNECNYEQYLLRAGEIKRDLVERDFKEEGPRKVLNFGHTLGHALESFTMTTADPLTHGESVAMGMWCALWLSVKLCGLSETVLEDYGPVLRMLLSQASTEISVEDVDEILGYLACDKKNKAGQTLFVLLEDIAEPVWDQEVPESLARESLAALFDFLY